MLCAQILGHDCSLAFLQKEKRSKGRQSLILHPLLEKNINKNISTSCPNPKSICKNFAKIMKKNCEKNCVKIV